MDTIMKMKVDEWLYKFKLGKENKINLERYPIEKLNEMRVLLTGYDSTFREFMINLISEELKIRDNKQEEDTRINQQLNRIKLERKNPDLINDGLEIVNKLILVDYDNVNVDPKEIKRLGKANSVVVVCNNQVKVNNALMELDSSKYFVKGKVVSMDHKQATDMFIQRCIIDALDMYPNLKIVVVSKDTGYEAFKEINGLDFEVVEDTESITDIDIPKIVDISSIINCNRVTKQMHMIKQSNFGEIIDLVPVSTVDDIVAENNYLKELVNNLNDTIEYLSAMVAESSKQGAKGEEKEEETEESDDMYNI